MDQSDWSKVPANYENVRSKEDIFDSDRFPQAGPCDMNYRIHASNGSALAICCVAAIGILAFGAAAVLRWFGTMLWSEFILASCCLGSCLIGLIRLLRSPSAPLQSILIWLAAGPVAWFVLSAFPLTVAPQLAWVFFAFIGVPVSVWFADRVAHHAVYWMTACPRVDITTMVHWRTDWGNRWFCRAARASRRHDLSAEKRQLHERVWGTRKAYRRGIAYVVLSAVVLPFVWYLSHIHQPFQVTCASTSLIMLIGMAGVALARTVSWPGAFGIYAQFVVHWLTHLGGEAGPPWVVRSPAGPNQIRLLTTLAVLIVLSTCLSPIADHFWWFLNGSAPRTSPRPEHLRARNRTVPEFGPIQSLRDLNRVVMQEMNRSGMQAGQHVAFLIETLCDFEQLNLAPNRDLNHPALVNAIDMSQALRERQVLYFYLVGATDNAGIAEIARLALFRLLAACIQFKHDHGRTPRAYCIIDEAQMIIANNIATVLAQARSHGLSMTLSHQTLSQLAPPGGPDMRELFMSCSSTKLFFSARDPWTQDYLSKLSGQTKYVDESVTYSARDGW